MEEFGRFWGLRNRTEEREAEERWGELRREIAGDYRQENQRWHQDPLSTRMVSEKMLIVESYPPHQTVANAFEKNPDGTWKYPDSPAMREAVRRFERGDYPLGTAFEDTLPRITEITYSE